jgi:hypothetical protein
MVFDAHSDIVSDAASAERRAWEGRELHGM